MQRKKIFSPLSFEVSILIYFYFSSFWYCFVFCIFSLMHPSTGSRNSKYMDSYGEKANVFF